MGQFGGFTGKGVKTIVPGKATAKIACRLVPDQDPYDILKVGQTKQGHSAELFMSSIRACHLHIMLLADFVFALAWRKMLGVQELLLFSRRPSTCQSSWKYIDLWTNFKAGVPQKMHKLET